jgi:hypothetical protein
VCPPSPSLTLHLLLVFVACADMASTTSSSAQAEGKSDATDKHAPARSHADVAATRMAATMQTAVPCLLPELIHIAAEYAAPLGADFDESCLDVPGVEGRRRPTTDGTALATIELTSNRQFVWIVGKETFEESGLTRWSLRIDGDCTDASVAYGVTTHTCQAARSCSMRCYLRSPGDAAAQYDPTGCWSVTASAQFHGKRTRWEWRPTIGRARTAALSLAEHKALTPFKHFYHSGKGDVGLEMHFEVDLNARTLRMQLHHPPDASVAAVAQDDWSKAQWVTHARAVRLTPSEVLTVPFPYGVTAASYRPALMLWGPITVSEIEPPAVFPLSANTNTAY